MTQRGLASGLVVTGSGLGGIVFPIIRVYSSASTMHAYTTSSRLFPKIGFGPSVRASGYLVLGFMIVGLCLMRNEYPPKRKDRLPSDIKPFFSDARYMIFMLGYGAAFDSTIWRFVSRIWNYLDAQATTSNSTRSNCNITSTKIFRFTPRYIMHPSNSNGSSIFGRVIGGHCADVYGPLNIQVCFTLATGATIWGVLGIQDTASLVVISIISGITSGAWYPLTYNSLASLAQDTSKEGYALWSLRHFARILRRVTDAMNPGRVLEIGTTELESVSPFH
ncbi:hypothetical protein D9758_016418 [Tetrapyrgos nigripes]|uniref:Uncharacterized protein n=1 Tax=Tetrapyrgos nigripes TaxID=182062 RepID=A0A8H5CMQ5_9AGAR|nr:hypothetical protein D9758_016418 [Tetrapyrgos nigripes]